MILLWYALDPNTSGGSTTEASERVSNETCYADLFHLTPTSQDPQTCFGAPSLACWTAQSQEDDVSSVLKGVSTASLDALNFVDYINQKYEAKQIR